MSIPTTNELKDYLVHAFEKKFLQKINKNVRTFGPNLEKIFPISYGIVSKDDLPFYKAILEPKGYTVVLKGGKPIIHPEYTITTPLYIRIDINKERS